MLLIVLALFWVALLTPIVVRRFRDGGTEKSILSFHAEHEVLSRQDYAVAPAHRLDQPDPPARAPETERRPRLTVVQPDDTVGTLESRSSWDEWSENYDYDDGTAREPRVANRYARAYSSRPTEPALTRNEPPLRRRSMRAQRRVMFLRCVAAAVVISLAAYITSAAIVVDLAALAWFGVVLFVALALYAIGEGYLDESALGLRLPSLNLPSLHLPSLHLPQRRSLATVQPLYLGHTAEYAADYDDEFASEFYEPETDEPWRRESQTRRAFG